MLDLSVILCKQGMQFFCSFSINRGRVVTTTTTTSTSTATAFVVTTRRPLEENIVITDPVGKAAASLLGRTGMLAEKKIILKKKPLKWNHFKYTWSTCLLHAINHNSTMGVVNWKSCPGKNYFQLTFAHRSWSPPISNLYKNVKLLAFLCKMWIWTCFEIGNDPQPPYFSFPVRSNFTLTWMSGLTF